MNFQAAVKGIAPAGGIRPASHITASSVSATKAEPAAQYFVGQRSPRGAPYGVSCGRERDSAYRPVARNRSTMTFMDKYKIMTPEIEQIDKTITLLKSQRQKLVAEAAKRKADALCAEMSKRKSK